MTVYCNEWGHACWLGLRAGACYLFELAVRIGRCISSRLVLLGAELGLMIWNGWDHWQARRQAAREASFQEHLANELTRRKAARQEVEKQIAQLREILSQEEERSISGEEGPKAIQALYEARRDGLRGRESSEAVAASFQKTMHLYTASLEEQLQRLPQESPERAPIGALLRWIHRDQTERLVICWAEPLYLSTFRKRLA